MITNGSNLQQSDKDKRTTLRLSLYSCQGISHETFNTFSAAIAANH